MLDARLRPLIDPPLNAVGRALARLGLTANMLTVTAMLAGAGAGVAVAHAFDAVAFALLALSRLCDGLDGAVARARDGGPLKNGSSELGAYLDIVGDFVCYLAVPLGFGLRSAENLRPALWLVTAFGLTGITFLAFAVMAGRRQLTTVAHGKKGFFYSTGIAEGTETIVVLLAMCVWPSWFPHLATGYAIVCAITIVQRTVLAWQTFTTDPA